MPPKKKAKAKSKTKPKVKGKPKAKPRRASPARKAATGTPDAAGIWSMLWKACREPEAFFKSHVVKQKRFEHWLLLLSAATVLVAPSTYEDQVTFFIMLLVAVPAVYVSVILNALLVRVTAKYLFKIPGDHPYLRPLFIWINAPAVVTALPLALLYATGAAGAFALGGSPLQFTTTLETFTSLGVGIWTLWMASSMLSVGMKVGKWKAFWIFILPYLLLMFLVVGAIFAYTLLAAMMA